MSVRHIFASVAIACAVSFASADAGEHSNGVKELAWFQTTNIYHAGLRGNHAIALTFDDVPNANTLKVLDVLKAANVKATFFVVGNMARLHPDILARITNEGHLLANHSATHPMLTSKYDADPYRLIAELKTVHERIAPFMKPEDKFYFRAPYGLWRSAHAAILNADPVLRDYVGPIYWDIGGGLIMHDGYVMSSADWACWKHKWTAQTCAKGYLREIRRENGGVVLMHGINKQSGELTAAVIPALVEEGYSFVRLDQVPEYRQYETPQTAPAVAGNLPLQAAALIDERFVK